MDEQFEDRAIDCHCGNRGDVVVDGHCLLCRCLEHPQHGDSLKSELVALYPFLEDKLTVPVRAHSRRGDTVGCGPMCTVAA